jgi:hypothetical protein
MVYFSQYIFPPFQIKFFFNQTGSPRRFLLKKPPHSFTIKANKAKAKEETGKTTQVCHYLSKYLRLSSTHAKGRLTKRLPTSSRKALQLNINFNRYFTHKTEQQKEGGHLLLFHFAIPCGSPPCTLEYTSPATLLSRTAPSSSLSLPWFF